MSLEETFPIARPSSRGRFGSGGQQTQHQQTQHQQIFRLPPPAFLGTKIA
jgi:hypothetical protein